MKLLKPTLTYLLLIVSFSNGLAQYNRQQTPKPETANDFIQVGQFIEGMAVIKKPIAGRRPTPTAFESTSTSSNDLYGYINERREVVVSPQYYYVEDFKNGIAKVGKGRYLLLYGFINKAGQEILPAEYNYIGPFCEGLAVIQKGMVNYPPESSTNCRAGYINTKGEVVIPMKFNVGGNFQNGEACVAVGGKYIYINTKGIWIRDGYTPTYNDPFDLDDL